MQHRSTQDEVPLARATAKTAATPLPAEWTRLLAATAEDADGVHAATLGFLLELVQDELPLARI